MIAGVDGGRTRTRALLTSDDGTPLVSVEGGPSAILPGHERDAAELIVQLLKEALQRIEIDLEENSSDDVARGSDRDNNSSGGPDTAQDTEAHSDAEAAGGSNGDKQYPSDGDINPYAADDEDSYSGVGTGGPARPERIRTLCVGVAGAGRPSVAEALRGLIAASGIADEVLVEPDASIALEDAFGQGPGILLIAGTGSVAFGRGPTGTFARCGGWGPACGDEGGGYWLGRRALSVVTAADDGREQETSLSGALLTSCQLAEPAELPEWAATATPAQIASLASVVLREAEAGDLRANSLVTLAAEELVVHLRTLARTLFSDERAAMPVAVTGGLMGRSSLLRKKLESRLKNAVPGAHLHADDVNPARGAIKRARRWLDLPVMG